MYIDDSNVTYFDSLAVEHIPKEIKTFIVNKNITINMTYAKRLCILKLVDDDFNKRLEKKLYKNLL